jgi:hypothetical protein
MVTVNRIWLSNIFVIKYPYVIHVIFLGMGVYNENFCFTFLHHHHHQTIKVPTVGAPAFLMDYLQEERVITHPASPVRIGACKRLQMQPGPAG